MEFPRGEKSSYNFYRVLRTIWQSGRITRGDLAKAHHLDKTTISQIVSELAGHGLVRTVETDRAALRPGRKSEVLSVNDDWGLVAGFEVRPDGINACGTNLHGAVLATDYQKRPVERTNLDRAFFESLDRLLANPRLAGRPLVGVGVGVTGIVARDEHTIVHSLPLNITEPYDFAARISGHLTVPVIVDNDANCCAWGRLVCTDCQVPRNFLFVLLEFRSEPDRALYGGAIGMGLGFVIDGSVYYGENGSAGEFRSLYWKPGLANQFAIPDDEAADVLARPQALQRLADEIAQHVALFVNSLNLKGVWIGGDVEPVRDVLIAAIQKAIAVNWPYSDRVECTIQAADNGRDIVASGAAAMVLEHVFADPAAPIALRERNDLWQQILGGRGAVYSAGRRQ